ncbi:F-box protein SKIP24-like isoform X5 [Diospyros lotus]|uniref:F-box protein SKIP24-like isoform X5 n=1 Tax=Diospyros lotus TaxID=55363 RepID=UPI002253FF8D|nr:F-box protein SKIP24-like isoform X5 [Diospyros lotus]
MFSVWYFTICPYRFDNFMNKLIEMADLPDELWRRILEIGVVETPNLLGYKDLCCLSITCRRLRRLSGDDSLWSSLFSSDFPLSSSHRRNSPPNSSSSKTLYRISFERDRARKAAAHKRAVLRIESQVAQHSSKMQEIQLQLDEENEKMKATVAELSNVRKVRQASVALNVWQPEVVRGRHKEIVEQCPVPADVRIHALENEFRLCKQQIVGLHKAYKEERKRLDAAKEQLASVKYHPLRDHRFTVDGVDDKRKRLKREHVK